MLQDRAEVYIVVEGMTSREHYHSTVIVLFIPSLDLNARWKSLGVTSVVLFASMLELNLAHNLTSRFVEDSFLRVIDR